MGTTSAGDDVRRAAGPKGRYRLGQPLGASRFASLWRADDSVLGEPVLVEVVRDAPPAEPDDAKLLRDRMAASQDLPLHPRLLAVRSMHAPEPPGRLAVASRAAARARSRRGVEEYQWLLVLDAFEGWPLDHRVAFRDPSPSAVCAIAAQVGDALGALHAVGIAHGSLTPSSVLVSDAGEVRVIDAFVGSWRGARDRDPLDADVRALARLVTGLLAPVAVPLELRRLLGADRDPTLGELVGALRQGPAPERRHAGASDRVVVLPDVDVDADADADDVAQAARPAPRAFEPARRVAREPTVAPSPGSAARPGTPSVTAPDRLVVLPEPPAAQATRLEPGGAETRPSLPPGSADRWAAGPETEPARWMKVASVIATLIMFAALTAAAIALLRS